MDATITLDMSNNILFAIIERMLGGTGEKNIIPDREYTEIEVTLMERIFKRVCMYIQEALQNIPDCRVTLRQIDTNSRLIKAIRMEEIVEVVVYNVTVDEITGMFTACIPYTFVQAAASMTDKDSGSSDGTSASEEERLLHLACCRTRWLRSAPPRNSHTFAAGAERLAGGRRYQLDQKNGDPILITVNGNSGFGRAGNKKYSKAIKINKYYNGRSKSNE